LARALQFQLVRLKLSTYAEENNMHRLEIPRRRLASSSMLSVWIGLAALLGVAPAHSLTVTPTVNPADLAAALNASGLTINSVSIVNGAGGQFGT
jgi:hypothetical protein